MNLSEILRAMVVSKASDVHLKAGAPPQFRIDGELIPQSQEPLSPHEVVEVVTQLCDEKQQKAFFEERHEVDLAYALEGLARFRTNIMWQRGLPEIIMRVIPQVVPRIEDINMPTAVLKQIALEPRGLILVTGITGSGKSTTLAALIHEMNQNRAAHIVTVEDPIEFVHPDIKSSITQREVGLDTETFRTALKYVLRQDPDVILIGEMRDVETVQAALTAAETGHLVLSTLHTMDTIQTMERILDFFPADQQNQIRLQLSNTLRAVISQRLIQKADGIGVAPAAEIMIVTPTIKSLIAENKINQIRTFVAEGQSQYGMQTFDQSLIGLVRQGLITRESAMEEATSPSEIDLGLKGISSSRASAQSLISHMESQQMKERLAGWLKRAQELYQRKRYDESRGELKRILQEVPDHKEANALMAKLREFDVKEEKRKDASQNVRGALQMFREGKLQAAVIELQKGLEIDPDNKQIQAYLADIQRKMQEMEEARTLLVESSQAQQAGDLAGALAKAEQALEKDASNEKVLNQVRDLKMGIQKAAARMKAAGHNDNAINLYKEGDLLGALVVWNKAYELNPELEEVSKYLSQGTAKLLSYGIEGIDGLPEKDAILAIFEQGVRSYIRSDFQMAQEFFRRAGEKAPGNAYLAAYLQKCTQMQDAQLSEFFQEGMSAQQAGDYARAQKEYNKVLRLSPGHPEVVRQLAELRTIIDQKAEEHYNQGKSLFDAGKMDLAVLAWNRILEIDPSNDRAKKRIEEARAKKNILSSIG